MKNGLSDSTSIWPAYWLLPCLVCFALCLIVDLAYFPDRTVFPDEQRILGSAAHLVATGQFAIGGDRAWEMPGPALFFAPAVWLFGVQGSLIPLRIMQALLVVTQCGLVAVIVRRIFKDSHAALMAAWLIAIYPFILFYQGLLLSETLFNTFLLAGMAALFRWRERGCRIDRSLLISCMLFVAATMTKATLTVLSPFLLAATAWLSNLGWRRTANVFVSASLIYAACMSPWWIRNGVLLHAFVPFTTSSAQNLYLGNNSRNVEAGIDWAHDSEPDVVAKINAIPDELARQQAYSNAAISYIVSQPATFIRNAGKKFLRLWNIVPNASEFRTKFYSAISAASFGPVLLLALFSAWQTRRRWREFTPIYILIGYFTFVHVVTIASLRYRLPIEPFLIVLAAKPLSDLIVKLRNAISLRTG